MKVPASFRVFVIELLISAFLPLSVYAGGNILNENFLDPVLANWVKNENSGSVIVKNGELTLSSPQTSNLYPYLFLSNTTFPQRYEISFDFKMSGPVNFGSGIIFTDKLLINGTQNDLNATDYLFAIWSITSPNHADLATRLCSNSYNCNESQYKSIATIDATNWVNIKIKFENKKYLVLINDSLVFESVSTELEIKNVWIGNPQFAGSGKSWATLSLDFLNINDILLDNIKTIVIPGFGASWDMPALLTGSSGSNWKIPKEITAYNSILESLEKAGYKEGEDLFVFPYDWRKNIDDLAVDLNNFISDMHLGSKKINIVGHSMGGLVGRAYSQKYPEQINKLITLGSPHKGDVIAYGLWEGAELWDDAWWEKVLIEIVSEVNRRPNETKVMAVRRVAPSVKDILPTESYLMQNDKPVTENSMKQKNEYLKNLNSDFGLIDSFTKVIWSEDKGNTKSKIRITKPSFWDRIINKWEDGKPNTNNPFIGDLGDGTVTKVSAIGPFTNSVQGFGGHVELVTRKDNIEKVFDALDISKTLVTGGISDTRKSAFVVSLRSPGTLHVCNDVKKCDGELGIYLFTDKLFILPGYENEKLKIEVKSNGESGKYTLFFGNITDSGQWEQSKGNIGSANQTDTYYAEGKYLYLSSDFLTSFRDLIRAKSEMQKYSANWDKPKLVEKLGDDKLSYKNRLNFANTLRNLLLEDFKKSSKTNNYDYFESAINMWNTIDRTVQEILSINISGVNLDPKLFGMRFFVRDDFDHKEGFGSKKRINYFFASEIFNLAEDKRNEAKQMSNGKMGIKADKIMQAAMLQSFVREEKD